MSVYGKIKKFVIVDLETELQNLSPENKSLDIYIRIKHENAEKNNRYIVALYIEDPIFEKGYLITVNVFLPKELIDNNLLELNSFAECSSTSCSIEILGILDHFDRAYNGATQIHDNRCKKDVIKT
jgi:hypothetical protein